MKRGLKGLIVTTLISFGITSIPLARAAHATNFLDALHAEITNRIANLDTNSTARDKRVLKSARAILEHNTRTFATDLSALARAAATLDTRFEDDATLHALGSNAVVAYSNEAHAELDDAELHIGTNSIPRGWSNQLARARAALNNADSNTTSVASRARATARVFNQIHQLVPKILRKYPTIPFEAPTDIATGQAITLAENAVVNDQTKFFFHTANTTGDRFLSYTSDNPEEVGTWTYERLTAKTATLHCHVDFTQAGAMPAPYSHDMSLTFTSATGGTFTGVNCLGEHIEGTFTIDG